MGLDVGFSKGPVSFPAAHATGPRGHVTGIDRAAPMLRHAAERARDAGLPTSASLKATPKTPAAQQELQRDPGREHAPVPPGRGCGLALDVLLTPGGALGLAWTMEQERARRR